MAAEIAIERSQGNPDIDGILTSISQIDMRQVVSMRLALISAKAQGTSQEEREEYDEDIADVTLNPTHVLALQRVAEFLSTDIDAQNLVSQVILKRSEEINPDRATASPYIKTSFNDPQEAITYANQTTAAFLLTEALETITITDETEEDEESPDKIIQTRILGHVRQALQYAQVLPEKDTRSLSEVLREMKVDFSFDQESYTSLANSLEEYTPDSLIVELSLKRLEHQAGIDNLLASLSEEDREQLFGEKGKQKLLGSYITSISELSRVAIEEHITNKKNELERLKKNLEQHIKDEGRLNEYINTASNLPQPFKDLANSMLYTSFDLRHLTEQLVGHQKALEQIKQEPQPVPPVRTIVPPAQPVAAPMPVTIATEAPRTRLSLAEIHEITDRTQQDYILNTSLSEILDEATLQELAPYIAIPPQRATLSYPAYYEALQYRFLVRARELVHKTPLAELLELQATMPLPLKEVIRQEIALSLTVRLHYSSVHASRMIENIPQDKRAHFDQLTQHLWTPLEGRLIPADSKIKSLKDDVLLQGSTFKIIYAALERWLAASAEDVANMEFTTTDKYLRDLDIAQQAISAMRLEDMTHGELIQLAKDFDRVDLIKQSKSYLRKSLQQAIKQARKDIDITNHHQELLLGAETFAKVYTQEPYTNDNEWYAKTFARAVLEMPIKASLQRYFHRVNLMYIGNHEVYIHMGAPMPHPIHVASEIMRRPDLQAQLTQLINENLLSTDSRSGKAFYITDEENETTIKLI